MFSFFCYIQGSEDYYCISGYACSVNRAHATYVTIYQVAAAFPLPGQLGDLHQLADAHAGHTKKSRPLGLLLLILRDLEIQDYLTLKDSASPLAESPATQSWNSPLSTFFTMSDP